MSINQVKTANIHSHIVDMKVGQKVRIRLLVDKVRKEIASKVGEVGVIKSPKIVDGSKMGYIVAFSDNLTTWFLPDELEVVR